MKKNRAQSIIGLIILIVTLTIVVSLFCLPIIISRLPDIRKATTDDDNTLMSNDSNITQGIYCNNETIGGYGKIMETSTSATCSNIQYTGTVCQGVLNTWQMCTVTRSRGNELFINRTVKGEDTLTLSEREQRVIDIMSVLGNHKECHQVSLPFLCQYYFPLYDCHAATMTTIYTATIEDCIMISTGVCSQIWNLAVAFGYEELLPNCNNLPSVYNDSNYANNYNISDNETQLLNSSFTCREDFINTSSSVCQPRCDRFEQSSHIDTQLMLYSELFTSIVGLLITIIVVLLSVKNYKTMFKYPSVILLIIVADYSIIALLSLIIAIDRSKLLCGSVSLLESIDNPTIFCTISGALFHYALVNMSLVWLFHVIIFFHKVVFPFHAHRMETTGKNKFILITVITLAFIIPLPAVILCLSVKDYGYRIRRFPPTICFSNTTNVWFISGIVLMDVVVCIGVCLLIIIAWTLHKEKKKFRSSGKSMFDTAEKKIIIVFVSIILFSVFALGDLSNYVARSDQFKSALTEYFTCESLGHIPGQCDRSQFTDIYTPYTTIVSQYLMALIPLTILNYIVKWESLKGTVRSTLRKRRTKNTLSITENTKTVDVTNTSSV